MSDAAAPPPPPGPPGPPGPPRGPEEESSRFVRAELHEGVGRPLDDLHREALAAPDEIDAAARIALSGVARAVPPPALGVNGPEVDRYDPDAGKDAYDSWRETTDGARQSTGSRVGTTDGGSLKK